MDSISLTSSMRANLLALRDTSALTSITQKRLATGLKVNSAIDNPLSYYTARSLHNRAGDLSVLLDSMSMGIQIIKAATEGVETGIKILEQMHSVAGQAVQEPQTTVSGSEQTEETEGVKLTTRDLSEFEAEGYKVIRAGMTSNDILNLCRDDAKLVLAEDIKLDSGICIEGLKDITIDGNGHTLSFDTSDSDESVLNFNNSQSVLHNINIEFTNTSNSNCAAIYVDGGDLEVSSVNINCKGNYAYGISAKHSANVTIDTTAGIRVDGEYAQKINDPNSSVYNGRSNTQALLNEIGADALAATAANQFYVGSKTDAHFGQGKWYLPAIGEWAEAYGTDTSQITNYRGKSGANGDNKILINNTLSALRKKGVEAEELGRTGNGYYWSSSEYNDNCSWIFRFSDGSRYNKVEDSNHSVRCFQLLENCFSGANAPKIGDVMYTDLSYGSADAYDGSKTAAGVVTWVSEDGKSAKIMNLKDLSFGSYNEVGKFNPDNPYNNTYKYTYHTTIAKYLENAKGIDDFTGTFDTTTITITNGENINGVDDFIGDFGGTINDEEKPIYLQNTEYVVKQFNELLQQYDTLIRDSSYKGINLINGDLFSVVFNEDMSSRIEMSGYDISSKHIGLNPVSWETSHDIESTIDTVAQAVSALRDVSVELGNSYSIIQTRHGFTQNLINVLTEGADNLTLADMNEEAANMLALQTRQQLGVTALSLSSQSARSVLSLFQS